MLPNQLVDSLLGLGVVFSFFILLPALIVAVQSLRRRRFFAGHPADCWGEDPLPEVYGGGVAERSQAGY